MIISQLELGPPVVPYAISWFDVSSIKYRKPRGWNLIGCFHDSLGVVLSFKMVQSVDSTSLKTHISLWSTTVNHVDETSLAVFTIV